MKAAISTDNGNVSAHFGRCPSFTLIEVEEGQMKTVQAIPNPGHHPGFLPKFLHEHGVECIVSGGMGARAQMLFEEQGIKTIMGASGSVDEVIEKLCAGTLQGGESMCSPGAGKGYGVEKTECTHDENDQNHTHV